MVKTLARQAGEPKFQSLELMYEPDAKSLYFSGETEGKDKKILEAQGSTSLGH